MTSEHHEQECFLFYSLFPWQLPLINVSPSRFVISVFMFEDTLKALLISLFLSAWHFEALSQIIYLLSTPNSLLTFNPRILFRVWVICKCISSPGVTFIHLVHLFSLWGFTLYMFVTKCFTIMMSILIHWITEHTSLLKMLFANLSRVLHHWDINDLYLVFSADDRTLLLSISVCLKINNVRFVPNFISYQ